MKQKSTKIPINNGGNIPTITDAIHAVWLSHERISLIL